MKNYNEDIQKCMQKIVDSLGGTLYMFDWKENKFIKYNSQLAVSEEYSDLFYIQLKQNKQSYIVASFYRDFDNKSGNIHVLPGAIEIWKGDINDYELHSKKSITYIDCNSINEIIDKMRAEKDLSKCDFDNYVNNRLKNILIQNLNMCKVKDTSNDYQNVVWKDIKDENKKIIGWESAYEIYVSNDGHIVAKYGKQIVIEPVNNVNGLPNKNGEHKKKSCYSPNDYDLKKDKWILTYRCEGNIVDKINKKIKIEFEKCPSNN